MFLILISIQENVSKRFDEKIPFFVLLLCIAGFADGSYSCFEILVLFIFHFYEFCFITYD